MTAHHHDTVPLALVQMLVALRSPGASSPELFSVSAEGTWQTPSEGEPELGQSSWALPGLVDSHAHLAADELITEPGEPLEIRRRAYACLERGTFLVVDKGWSDDSVLMTLTDMAPTSRPDFQAAGRMIAVEGGYYPGFAVETDAEGLEGWVARLARESRGWVKLVGDWPRKGRGAVANFTVDQLEVAVQVAHAAGARVAIHTMAPEVPSMAVAAGVDSIEHGLFLTEADLELLAARDGAWVPTVLRMEAIGEMLGPESTGGRLVVAGIDNVRELLSIAPSDLAVLAGTDLATGPGDVSGEVLALIRLGLPPERAVAAASSAARSYLGRPRGFQQGEPADAVFYDADPIEDPSTLSRPVTVLRAGRRVG